MTRVQKTIFITTRVALLYTNVIILTKTFDGVECEGGS